MGEKESLLCSLRGEAGGGSGRRYNGIGQVGVLARELEAGWVRVWGRSQPLPTAPSVGRGDR